MSPPTIGALPPLDQSQMDGSRCASLLAEPRCNVTKDFPNAHLVRPLAESAFSQDEAVARDWDGGACTFKFSVCLIKFMLNFIAMQSLVAIADPTRRRIVELLAQRERTAGELVDEFEMSAPAISQHLKVLREAGLVTVRAEGQSRVQLLNPAGLDELGAWLEETRSVWSRRLDALERELRAEDEAAARKAKKKTSS